MVKIFFATFFIAELIIAISIVLRIYKFDKCVNYWNNIVVSNQGNIKTILVDIRLLMEYFAKSVVDIKAAIRKKRQEYIVNFLKNAIVYVGIFTLRGKYKKAILSYQLIKEVYEGISEAED